MTTLPDRTNGAIWIACQTHRQSHAVRPPGTEASWHDQSLGARQATGDIGAVRGLPAAPGGDPDQLPPMIRSATPPPVVAGLGRPPKRPQVFFASFTANYLAMLTIGMSLLWL
jgi:hypothetical protein